MLVKGLKLVDETADLEQIKLKLFEEKNKKCFCFLLQVQYNHASPQVSQDCCCKMFQMSQDVSLQVIHLFGPIILGDIRYDYSFFCVVIKFSKKYFR
jgi:hypothetical protein